MKRSLILSWILIVIVFGLAVTGLWHHGEKKQEWTAPDPGVRDSAVMIRVKLGDTVETMSMDAYLQGVLRAEMPATFEIEALKAQAVAARTETLYKVENGPSANHPDADICGDFRCCQAYKSVEDANAAWGRNCEEYAAKIATAVRETDGMTILYEEKPILAAFFSSADGDTNPAGEVWIQDLPYLQSVKSPESEKEVPNYYSTEKFSEAEFKEIFLKKYPDADLSGKAEGWFGPVQRSDSDMVLSVEIGGVSVKGTELRAMFALRSASFTVSAEDGQIIFHVTGYGHGVGMSQYGANVMASEGKDYQEILQWYYTGVTVAPYTPKTLASAG